MENVGAFEAKTHLAALLDRVATGERITITRRGAPVAMLVPVAAPVKPKRDDVIQQLIEFGKGRSLRGLTIRELIEQGRRF